MSLEYITINIPVPDSPCSQVIESQLIPLGTPIRWAMTRIEDGVCTIEAVVYRSQKTDCTLQGHPGVLH